MYKQTKEKSRLLDILNNYRCFKLESIEKASVKEPISEHLLFISVSNTTLVELVILRSDKIMPIEVLDNHIQNKISYNYELSDYLYNLIKSDGLIDDLEDKLMEVRNFIKLKYV